MILFSDFHLFRTREHIFRDEKATLGYFCFHALPLDVCFILRIPLKQLVSKNCEMTDVIIGL